MESTKKKSSCSEVNSKGKVEMFDLICRYGLCVLQVITFGLLFSKSASDSMVGKNEH